MSAGIIAFLKEALDFLSEHARSILNLNDAVHTSASSALTNDRIGIGCKDTNRPVRINLADHATQNNAIEVRQPIAYDVRIERHVAVVEVSKRFEGVGCDNYVPPLKRLPHRVMHFCVL